MNKIVFLSAALLAAPAWAVHKCTGTDGKVTFQDAPCVGKGEKMDVRPASGPTRAVVNAAPTQTPPAPPVSAQAALPALAVQPAPAAAATHSPLAREADMCLAWHRPLLRDPAGAYYTEPTKEDRVLSITVHETNGYGGYVTSRAACEIYLGKLNESWTKIHAKRGGW